MSTSTGAEAAMRVPGRRAAGSACCRESLRHLSVRGLLGLLVGAMLAVVAVGCGGADGAGPAAVVDAPPSGGFHGDVLEPPFRLSRADLGLRFRSTTGGRTTLGELGRDRLLLLYFGYTHCPDVCPITMSTLGSALRQLPPEASRRVQVVFVTSDPGRDSPSVMRSWLSNFDAGLPRRFVGLTSSYRDIRAVARPLKIYLQRPVRHEDGTVTVGHSAEVLALRDGDADLLWTSNTPADAYAEDLARLLDVD